MPLFLFFFLHIFITYIHSFIQSHSYNTFIHSHSLRPLSISSSLLCSVGKHLPVVPSRESNSGLPYSKLTRYQLSHATPYEETWSRSFPSWTRGPKKWHVSDGNHTWASLVGGEHSRKETVEQLVNFYSEHLHMSARPISYKTTK